MTEQDEREERARRQLEAAEMVDDILKLFEEFKTKYPAAPAVFVCSLGPGNLSLGKNGDPLMQLGLLDLASGFIEAPMVAALHQASAPRIQPASQIPPGAIPFNKGRS